MDENKNGKTYKDIKERADKIGVKLSLVCRKAGVDRSTLERWKLNDPKSIRKLNALNDALDKLEKKSENA
ncbi:MAG: hypothetical protein JKY43_03170 [Phycisphaerales bacterium]|nr:hypothetical protein [Phycisphaerales bacterium]